VIANHLVQLAAEEKQNPLVPAGPELLVGAIAFAIVFFFFWKKLLPNINKVLEERREAIEGGIEKAEAAQVEAQSVLEQINQLDSSLERAVEAYNLANVKLSGIKHDLATNTHSLTVAKRSLKNAQRELSARLVDL